VREHVRPFHTLTPPPLTPSCLPQQVGEGKRKKVVIALPPGEGKSDFLRTYYFYCRREK